MNLRYDVFRALRDLGPSNTRTLANYLGIRVGRMSRTLWYLAATEMVTADKTQQKNYIYSLAPAGLATIESEPEAAPVIRPAIEFHAPLNFCHEPLSPMAWSLRHLLGAAG